MKNIILFLLFYLFSYNIVVANCTSTNFNFKSNTLYIKSGSVWTPVSKTTGNIENTFRKKDTATYAYFLKRRSPNFNYQKNSSSAILIKNTNFASTKNSKIPSSVYIDSNRKPGWFQKIPKGNVKLRTYIFVHLGKIKIARTRLAAFHFKYKNNGNARNTYSELRRLAFLFDDIEVNIIGEEDPKLASLIRSIKNGQAIDDLRRQVTLVSIANAKEKFVFSSKPKNDIIQVSSILRKYPSKNRPDGIVTCFKLRHLPSNTNLTNLSYSRIKIVDFDGPIDDFDDPPRLGRSDIWRINWRK